MKNISIIPFEKKHEAGLVRLISDIQEKEFRLRVSLGSAEDPLQMSLYETGRFLVALDSEVPIGSIGLINIGQGDGCIRRMYVDKNYRSLGLAVNLLDATIDYAQQIGINRLLLGTRAEYLRAHRFYEKNGFLEIDEKLLPAHFPKMRVDSKFYQRKI